MAKVVNEAVVMNVSNASGVSLSGTSVSGVSVVETPTLVEKVEATIEKEFKAVEQEVVKIETAVVKEVKEGFEEAKKLLEGRKAELEASLPAQPTVEHKTFVQKLIGEIEGLIHHTHKN